jgi:hypothetical protein
MLLHDTHQWQQAGMPAIHQTALQMRARTLYDRLKQMETDVSLETEMETGLDTNVVWIKQVRTLLDDVYTCLLSLDPSCTLSLHTLSTYVLGRMTSQGLQRGSQVQCRDVSHRVHTVPVRQTAAEDDEDPSSVSRKCRRGVVPTTHTWVDPMQDMVHFSSSQVEAMRQISSSQVE